MGWTIASSGLMTHAGTTLEVAVTSVTLVEDSVVAIQSRDITDRLRARVLMSPDGRSAWEVGIDADDATKISIRPVRYGVLPAARSASSFHGIPAGLRFTLEVSIQGATLSVRAFVTAGTYDRTISFTITDGEFLGFRGLGIVSDVDGATALVEYATLIPAQTTEVDALLIVCGGRLYMALDESTHILISGRAVAESNGPVSITTMDRKAYIAAPGLASVFDPEPLTIIEWTVSDGGELPWMTAEAIAASTVPIIWAHNSRIFAGVNAMLYASALTYPNRWRYNDVDLGAGAAFFQPARDNIVCLATLPNTHLFVGCVLSMKMLIGDPALGQIQLIDATLSHGASGPKAFAMVDGTDLDTSAGSTLGAVHSPDGVYIFPPQGLPYPLFDKVLTEGIQFPRTDRTNYIVSMVQDPTTHGLHIFLTPRATGPADHWVYEERVGGYSPNRIGLMRERYPDSAGPTAAVLWRGKVVYGTRDGLLLTPEDPDDSPTHTDDGAEIVSFMPFTLMADGAPVGDTVLSFINLVLSETSDAVKLKLFAGRTAEQVYETVLRQRRFTATVTPASAPLPVTVRGMALIAEMSSSGVGTTWEIEQLVVQTEMNQVWSRRGLRTAPAIGVPCPSPEEDSGGGPVTPPVPGTGPGGGGPPPVPPGPPPPVEPIDPPPLEPVDVTDVDNGGGPPQPPGGPGAGGADGNGPPGGEPGGGGAETTTVGLTIPVDDRGLSDTTFE